MSSYDKLFEPGRIGNLTLKNRLIMEPIGTRYADSRGHVTGGTWLSSKRGQEEV